MKKHLFLKSLLVAIGLLVTSLTTQVLADTPYIEGFGLQFREGSSTLYTKTSTKGDGGIQDLDLGVKSDLKIVYIYANGNKNGGNLCTDQNYFKYEIYGPTGTAHWDGMNREFMGGWYGDYSEKITYKWGYENGTSAISDPSGSFELTEGRTPGEYNMQFYFSFEGNKSSSGCGSWYDCKYDGNNWKFSWTIPGFRGAPASKAFGTIPVDKEAETTISFNHYGNALEAEDFVITGSSDFTVRSFSESGVNVVFSPTTTGSKSATLTITDDYDNTCTISLTGTAASAGTVGTVTTLYFNDYQYDGAGDWAASSAGYRFVCAYTDGVYTHYNMTKCPNTEHTYTAQVEIVAEKSISIDRYNPSTYAMWNSATPSNPGLSSTNPYAKSKDINGAYATNHPYNDVGNRRFYYDNSASGFTNTLCLLIGRDKQVSDDASNTYSKAYTMSPVTNTKLYYCAETAGTDMWHDVTYYAVIGTSSDASTISGWSSSNNWGSSTITTKGDKGYTAAYTSLFGLIDGNVYLASASSYSGGAMTINKCASTTSSFNSTQTIKYALSTDGGDSYSDMSSGNTPGQISISAYKFVDGTYNSVTNTSNTATISSNTSGTYSTSVPAAYTGETTLSASARDGYTFVDWNGSATTLNPKAAATYTARFKANQYTLSFNDEGATTAGGNSDRTVTFEQSTNLGPVSLPKKEGYNFNGYWTTASGAGVQVFAANGNLIVNVTGYIASSTWTYDGDVELHARWTDDGTYYFSGNNGSSTAWGTAANWTKGVVPGSTSNVILLKPVQVPAGETTTVNSVKIATSGSYTPDGGSAITAAGKLTIPAEAMLVVTTSVQNSAADGSSTSATTAASLHIEAGNTTSDGNGALVWGTSGTPGYATVDFCTKSHGANSEDDINQYIGTPFANNPTMLNQYYNSWMYKIEYTDGVHWVRINGDATLNEFEGYNLITAYEAGTVYSMEGQLVSNADVTLNGSSSTPKLVYNGGDGTNPNNENVLANSWVAPIKIKNFVDGNFTNVEKSIYIFNAGSPKQAETALEGQAGNYTTYSIGTVGETAVIPSMQSFSVYTSGATPSLILDYSELVQKDASNGLIEPNHAPKRYMNDKMDLLKVRVEGDNGWADELKVYIRNDFKSTFEDGWDAHKMYGYPQAPQLYAATADGAMAINCVPTVDNNVVAFQAGSASNEYTMSFAYDGEETIYLNDTKAAVSQEITEDKTYDFTAASGDNVARFTITKSPVYKVPTGMENTEGFINSASKLMIDGTLYIIRDGRIYNAEGSLVK